MQSTSFQKLYLVTGAAGFIGARFVESCNQQGIAVISVDRPLLFSERMENRDLNFGTLIDLEKLFPLLSGPPPVSPLVNQISAIVHLGAITDTRESDPSILKRMNLEYTQALWNFATRTGTPFIYASSAATYGDGTFGYDDQESLISNLKPLNAYGDSKQQFDLWALGQDKPATTPPSGVALSFLTSMASGSAIKDLCRASCSMPTMKSSDLVKSPCLKATEKGSQMDSRSGTLFLWRMSFRRFILPSPSP